MKAILSIAIALTPFAARADFSGHWAGTGSGRDNGTWKTTCQDMQIDAQQTATDITLKYNFVCDHMTIQENPTTLQIVNGRLLAGGKDVGMIDDQMIMIDATSDDGRRFSWDVSLNPDGSVEYTDHAEYTHGTWMEMQGHFTRK